MGLFSRKKVVDEETHQLIIGEGIDQAIELAGITGNGETWTEVVGESFYQDNLKQIASANTQGDDVLALVHFEPTNEFDKNAIVVKIAGLSVGYIPKGNQKWVAAKIRKVKKLDGVGAYARAQLIGGWDHGGGDTGMFGVELDLGED